MATNNAVNNGLSGATGTVNFVGSTSPTITTPLIVTGLQDANGNSMMAFNPADSAVNSFTIQNSATLNLPTFGVKGSDTNISFSLISKGTGGVNIKGFSDGSSAPAGYVGQVITSNIPFASPVTLTTTNTSYDITSIALTAGQWIVFGNVFIFSSVNLLTAENAWINTSSVTPPDNSKIAKFAPATGAQTVWASPVPFLTVNVSGAQNVYLSVNVAFTSTSPTGCGTLTGIRIR